MVDIRKIILDEVVLAEDALRKIESGFLCLEEPRIVEEYFPSCGETSKYQDGWQPAVHDEDPYYACALFRAGRIPLPLILFRNPESLQGRVIEEAYKAGLLDEAVEACREYVAGMEGWDLTSDERLPEGMLDFIPARKAFGTVLVDGMSFIDYGDDVDAELAAAFGEA